MEILLSSAAAAFILLADAPAVVVAQPAVVPQATAAILEPVVTDNILRAGTEVPLIIREELTTKKKQLRVGQRIQMEVAANVTKNGVVVIPAGAPAIGEITEVRNKGMWGKSGYIGARVISLRIGDRYIRLTGTFDDKGVTGTGGVVAAVAFVPIAGFFTTGTSAFIASGSAVKGFLDEDIAYHPVTAAPQVIDVPAASVPPAPVAAQPAGVIATAPTPAAQAAVATPAVVTTTAPSPAAAAAPLMTTTPVVQPVSEVAPAS